MKLPDWVRWHRQLPKAPPELVVMEAPPTDHTITTRVVEVMEKLVALDALKEPDAIANFLEWNGHVGRRGEADYCPLRHYLGPDVTVGLYSVSVKESSQRINIPRCVRTFIVLFDDGQYPFLEAK